MTQSSESPKEQELVSTRRSFVREATGAAALFSIVPAHVLGREGKTRTEREAEHRRHRHRRHGRQQPRRRAPAENIVALCDVDSSYAAKTFEKFPPAKAIRRFPRHARQAEGHRRGDRGHARPHARRDRPGGHASGASTSTFRSRWPTRCHEARAHDRGGPRSTRW